MRFKANPGKLEELKLIAVEDGVNPEVQTANFWGAKGLGHVGVKERFKDV